MTEAYDPRVGDWYRLPSGTGFEIVARDEDDDSLDIQYEDGTLEELDMETWETLHAHPAPPPEDPALSMDLPLEDEAAGDADWPDLLAHLEQRLS